MVPSEWRNDLERTPAGQRSALKQPSAATIDADLATVLIRWTEIGAFGSSFNLPSIIFKRSLLVMALQRTYREEPSGIHTEHWSSSIHLSILFAKDVFIVSAFHQTIVVSDLWKHSLETLIVKVHFDELKYRTCYHLRIRFTVFCDANTYETLQFKSLNFALPISVNIFYWTWAEINSRYINLPKKSVLIYILGQGLPRRALSKPLQ